MEHAGWYKVCLLPYSLVTDDCLKYECGHSTLELSHCVIWTRACFVGSYVLQARTDLLSPSWAELHSSLAPPEIQIASFEDIVTGLVSNHFREWLHRICYGVDLCTAFRQSRRFSALNAIYGTTLGLITDLAAKIMIVLLSDSSAISRRRPNHPNMLQAWLTYIWTQLAALYQSVTISAEFPKEVSISPMPRSRYTWYLANLWRTKFEHHPLATFFLLPFQNNWFYGCDGCHFVQKAEVPFSYSVPIYTIRLQDNFFPYRKIHFLTFLADLINQHFQTFFACITGPLSSPKTLCWGMLWIWVHVLQCNVSNQYNSVNEDVVNKPWRPLPSKRISFSNARRLRWLLAILCTAISGLSGREVSGASISLTLTTIIYDELGVAGHWVGKNLCGVLGYTTFEVGATMIIGNANWQKEPHFQLTLYTNRWETPSRRHCNSRAILLRFLDSHYAACSRFRRRRRRPRDRSSHNPYSISRCFPYFHVSRTGSVVCMSMLRLGIGATLLHFFCRAWMLERLEVFPI